MAILNHGSTIRTADGGQSTTTIVTASNIGTYGVAANSTYFIGTTQNVFNRASGAQTLTGVSIDGNAATVTNGVYTTGTQTIGGAKTFSDGIVVNGATYYTFNKPTTNAYQTVALFGSASAGLFLTTDSAIIGVGAYYNNGWIATATSGRQIDFAGGTFTFNAFSGATVGGAASWGTVAQLSSAGVFSATGDFRAPIFYDSNNTAYYIDAASTSNVNNLTAAGTITATNIAKNSTSPIVINSGLSASLGLRVYYDMNLYNTLVFTDSAWNSQGRIFGSSSVVTIQAATTTTSFVKYAGYSEEGGSFRAPIFYDSNDTAYYIDPSSLSNILELKTNKNWYDSSASAWGGGINMGGNNPSIGFQSTASTWWYMLHHSSSAINFYRRSTSGSWNHDGIWDSSGNFIWQGSSVRAPIFYDQNNTSYYCDPSSTSNLVGLTVANTITGSVSGNAATATNVAWTGITGGARTNYLLEFQPPVSSYAGFAFKTSAAGEAGYFLVRGTSDTDVYTAEGITLVADAGWLTLAQRTTASRGVRIMTGTSSAERLKITTAGDVQIVNGNSFTYNSNVVLHAGNYGAYSAFSGSVSSGGNITATGYLNVGSYVYSATYLQTGGNLIYPSGYGATQRLEVSNSANNNWIDGITIAPGGIVTAPYEIRSPIFYDSNNTSYYLDPANSGTSLLVAGSIGAGLTTPLHKIQASGLISASDATYNNDSTFIGAILNNDGTNPGLDLRRWNGGAAGTNNHGTTYIATNSAGDTIFYNGLIAANTRATNEKMRIAVNGNVGIGTTSPSQKLHVVGTGFASADFRAPIFYDSDNTTYYLDPNASTSGNLLGVLKQNDGKFVRDSYFRTISGVGDYYASGASGWYTVASITLTTNCTGGVLYGTLYDNRYDGADAYQIAIVARAECDFTTNNESHYVNVGCTILGSTNIINYQSKIRVLLVASSANSRTYEVQFFETSWNRDTWQLETGGSPVWTIYSTAQAPGTSTGTARVFYISNKNADNIRANTASYSPIYYDSSDTSYYSDPAGLNRFNALNIGNQGALTGNTTYALGAYHNSRYMVGLRYSSGGAAYPWLVHDSWNGSAFIIHFNGVGDRFHVSESGIAYVTGDFRAPIFYDSNNTSYYLDPASTSNLNALVVAASGRVGGAASRSTSGLTVGFTDNSTFAANTDVGDTDRMLSIVNESSTTNAMSVLGFRVNPNGGTANAMLDVKFVQTGATNTSALHYTFNHGGTFADRFSILSSGNVGIGTTSPTQLLDVRGNIKLGGDNSGNYVYYVTDIERTIVRTTRSDVTQEGLLRSDGWGNFTFSNNIGVGLSLGTGYGVGSVGSGIVYANGSVRAPIFYDSNNTSYYLDPASTSNLVGLTVANTITGSISGNAATATTSLRSTIEDTRAAQRTPNDYDDYRASYEFTNAITGLGDWHSAFTLQGWHNGYAAWQIIGPASTSAHENFYLRSGVNTTWNSVRTILHSGNYNSYSPTLTGTGASGSWGINITGSSASSTGNAATATTLQTARNINGTSFNGSANITTASWGTARTITIGSTGKSVDGSGNVAWSLAEIGAAATNQTMFIGTTSVAINRASASQTLTGISIDGSSASCTGNSATTTLATKATRANGNFYIDDNYGNTVVGLYSASRYQGVFAMGDSYKLAADGTTTGTLYGIAWSHPNAGGTAANLNTHGALILENGAFLAALSGSIRSRDDMRTPIFYDSNNTSYYVDPASTSNLNVLNAVSSTTLWVRSGSWAGDLTSNGFTREIGMQMTGGSEFVILSKSGQGYTLVDGSYYAYEGGGFYSSFNSSYGAIVGFSADSTTSVTFNCNVKAPIYYDSANTSFYVDPATGTVLDNFIDLGIRNSTGVLGRSVRIEGVNDASGEGSARIFFTENNNGSPDAYGVSITYNGTGSSPVMPSGMTLGGANAEWAFWGHDASINGTKIMYGFRNETNLYVVGSVRSPIFYDSNDTGYYIDAASTSSLNSLISTEVYARNWFRNNDSGEGIYNQATTQHFYSDDVSYWNVASSSGVQGIRFRTGGHGGTVRGYVYANDSNDVGLLNNGGNWRLRIVGGDYTLIDGSSVRAQIFYDSNDTTYYGDFASTSWLRQLSVGDVNAANDGGWNARLNLTGSQHARLDVKSNSDGIITTIYSHTGNAAGKVGTMSNHPLVFMVNGNAAGYAYANYLQGADSVRAPIFYDSDNTGYYLNPASTSNLNSLVIAGTLTSAAYNNLANDYIDIYVYGDVNTYYVVLIQGEYIYSFGRYSVTRGYNWTGPDTWNTASHKGGLTLDWEWSGDTAWGGNDKAIRIIEFNESYSNMVAGLGYPVNGGVIIWLRGGGVNGAQYRIRTPIGSNSTVTVYDGVTATNHSSSTSFTAADSTVFSTRANTNNVSAEISARYPVRGAASLYNENNAVLDQGSTSQTKSGILSSSASLRAPIFYDTDNTAYFIDGAGTSNLLGLTVTNTITGSVSGNAVTAGGLAVHSARNNEANKIVRTDSNGYIQAGWINTTSGDNGTTAIDRVYASSDGYIRYYTPANFRTVLDVPTRGGSGASGSWGISITGNAATATSATTATGLNSSNYISRVGSSGNYNTDFQNTPAGTVRHLGDDANATNNPGGSWWFVDNYRHSNGSNYWGTQVAWGWEDQANKLATRNITGGTFGSWVYYLNSGNYSNYAIARGGDTVDGITLFRSNKGATSTVGSSNTYALQTYSSDAGAAGMSFHRGGYYAVNMGLDPDNVFRIGGWSASANRLQLDMSGNLTLAGVVDATQFRDSSNTAYFIDPASTSNLVGLTVANTITGSITGNAGGSSASCSGNAATATILQTARTIGGVSFNGSANINLPGVNTAGNQNTTGTAANVTGTVAIANGGTGATTAAAARSNLGIPAAETSSNQSLSGSTTCTIDVAAANVHILALASGTTISSFTYNNRSASPLVNTILVVLKFAGTATVTWSNVVWSNGTTPTLTGVNGKADVYSLTSYKGGTTGPAWIGSVVGQNMDSTNL